MDDFKLAGERAFLEEVIKGVKSEWSKVEEDKFRSNEHDVERRYDGIVVSLNNYRNSVEEVINIRKV